MSTRYLVTHKQLSKGVMVDVDLAKLDLDV